MIYIKKFIDKVSMVESKQGKDIVLPITEARGLRDELAKVLVDNFQLANNKKSEPEPTIKIDIKGSAFK